MSDLPLIILGIETINTQYKENQCINCEYLISWNFGSYQNVDAFKCNRVKLCTRIVSHGFPIENLFLILFHILNTIYFFVVISTWCLIFFSICHYRQSSSHQIFCICVTEIRRILNCGCRNCRKYFEPTRPKPQSFRFCQSERSQDRITHSIHGLSKLITRKSFARWICSPLTILRILIVLCLFFVCWLYDIIFRIWLTIELGFVDDFVNNAMYFLFVYIFIWIV